MSESLALCRNPHYYWASCCNRMTQEDGLCDDCRWGRDNGGLCGLAGCACGETL